MGFIVVSWPVSKSHTKIDNLDSTCKKHLCYGFIEGGFRRYLQTPLSNSLITKLEEEAELSVRMQASKGGPPKTWHSIYRCRNYLERSFSSAENKIKCAGKHTEKQALPPSSGLLKHIILFIDAKIT